MDEERRELVRRLFAEATARIEAAHDSAVHGQSPGLVADEYADTARRLRATVQDIAVLAEAVWVITTDRTEDAGRDHPKKSC